MILGNCTTCEAISPHVKWGAWALRVKVRFLWLRKARFLVRHTYLPDARRVLKSKSPVCLSPAPPMGRPRVSNSAQFALGPVGTNGTPCKTDVVTAVDRGRVERAGAHHLLVRTRRYPRSPASLSVCVWSAAQRRLNAVSGHSVLSSPSRSVSKNRFSSGDRGNLLAAGV